MIRVTALGSGSRGNALLIDGADSSILVDAGFGPRALIRRLLAAGRHPGEISALYLTHEHTDHACGALAACVKWGWTLRANAATLAALAQAPDDRILLAQVSMQQLDDTGSAADGWRVQRHAVPHDARDCSAFVFMDIASGARIGVALDLGHVPDTLPAAFAMLDLLVVESNHDERMLANGPYPWMLKRRIGGMLGHLSNGAAAAFMVSCVHRNLRGVLLAHLSETNNTAELAVNTARSALKRAGWRRDAVWAALQSQHVGPVTSAGQLATHEPLQLSLTF